MLEGRVEMIVVGVKDVDVFVAPGNSTTEVAVVEPPEEEGMALTTAYIFPFLSEIKGP